MKKIVFVIGNFKNGGVSAHSTGLANELVKRGYDVTILVCGEIGRINFYHPDERVHIVSLDEFNAENRNNPVVSKEIKARDKRLKDLESNAQLYGKLRFKTDKIQKEIRSIRIGARFRSYAVLNPDAVYICFGWPRFEPAFYATHSFNSKIIYAERTAPEMEFKAISDREVAFEILKQANGAVLQTESERLFYGDGICENARVIYNPIKQDLPEPYSCERDNRVVTFCRVNDQKNLGLLIDSFLMFRKSNPDYTLEIYGNTVDESEAKVKAKLEKKVRDNNAGEFIKVLPPCADVHEKVRSASMFVSSSDFEGLSNTMIEAMAIGLPCICTDCIGGGAREMIKNGVNGLLVPIKDPNSLCDAMKLFAQDRELASKCAENALEIRKRLSAAEIGKQWEKMIESV